MTCSAALSYGVAGVCDGSDPLLERARGAPERAKITSAIEDLALPASRNWLLAGEECRSVGCTPVTLPEDEGRREVIEAVVADLDEVIRGDAPDMEVALARLAPPLARVSSAIANVAVHLGSDDADQHEQAVSGLIFAVEEVATAVLAVFKAGGSTDASDPDRVEALIDKPARGYPVWHEQTELVPALEIWTTDLYQDLNNALVVYGKANWNGVGDLIRTVRDCVELSAWLKENHRPER